MKPVMQTIKHGEGIGNCLQACIASILELSLDEVPHFSAEGPYWWECLSEFLDRYGLEPVQIGTTYRVTGYRILTGLSPRGNFLHSVVALGKNVVHDPHPDAVPGKFLEEVHNQMVFVMKNPARLIHGG